MKNVLILTIRIACYHKNITREIRSFKYKQSKIQIVFVNPFSLPSDIVNNNNNNNLFILIL